MELEQGLHNLATLIHSCHRSRIIGRIFLVMMERWSWFIGFCPFSYQDVVVVYDESVWLSSINNFMKTKNITMSLSCSAPPLLRENDEYLMVIAHKLGLGVTEIRYLNYC